MQQEFIWQCVGKSIRGAAHQRSGLINQDAVLWYPNYPRTGQGLPMILAVSDGHGSSTNFRSDRGSRIAVEVATDIIIKFLACPAFASFTNLKMFKRSSEQLCRQIHQEWMNRVLHDWQQDPVSSSDQQWNQLAYENNVQETVLRNPEIAYGATLLVVLATNTSMLYFQIGDGDILCVDTEGNVSRPMQHDPRLIANQTTSLCLPNAWKEFQVVLRPYSDHAEQVPALILLSTDGYANSFPTEQDFLAIGQDYWQMLRSHTLQELEQYLEQFLDETSTQGSGDDITLGIMQRLPSIEPKSRYPAIQQSTPMISQTTQLETSTLKVESSLNRLEAQQNRLSKQIKRLCRLVLLLMFVTISTLLAGALFALSLDRRLKPETVPSYQREPVEKLQNDPRKSPNSQPTVFPTPQSPPTEQPEVEQTPVEQSQEINLRQVSLNLRHLLPTVDE